MATRTKSGKTGKKLARLFYDRPTLEVARDLLGKHLVFRSGKGLLSARIVETEAYIGKDDPACHAARGKTDRNAVMFGPPGFAYVYFIYGMYHCLNFVTEPEDFPAAVLIRAAEPVTGLKQMLATGRNQKPTTVLSGPGKLCRAFGLNRDHSGMDLTGKELYVEDHDDSLEEIVDTVRVGIKVGADLPWRFYDAASTAVSRPR